jgi:outer membrane biosynthesis protein TonB
MRFFAAFITLALAVSAFGQGQAPRALSSPDPVYPAEAAEMGLGGSVRVHVKVDKKGEVSPEIAFGPVAPCSRLDDKRAAKIREAAVAAAKKARFEPLVQNVEAVSFEMTLTYHFDKDGKPLRRPDDGEVIETGVLQGRIKYMARPNYPPSAKANRIAGAVPVSVLIDTDGKIIAAAAIGGHPYLRHEAALTACKSTIEPVTLKGTPVQVRGVINYHFVP